MLKIAKVFPVLFYLVAILVSLTTMTRMVEEERSELGTLKSLGYEDNQILFKYMLYALLASVIGSILGVIIGTKTIPKNHIRNV
ncbi:MAG: FtsX-like permease family protein [Clostridium sp.]|nr:MAG: FtsX-like permease family protein [Clostridium sp.]